MLYNIIYKRKGVRAMTLQGVGLAGGKLINKTRLNERVHIGATTIRLRLTMYGLEENKSTAGC